ncbi:hypothetical protein CAPTEDRAFT_221033 [Capitella teleta]|uniref:Uncharacterized protein n=1 Tax=Capitella teleta TaxID=283909 RepID=R7VH91_CAPTE|nr:hypothetical protein CAPTEDRAFT_221033 [Capitella teleta]|eukprot:ELU15070.1 hypothetical protein CAPTEDRAFT_221033 [Capitella teleta]
MTTVTEILELRLQLASLQDNLKQFMSHPSKPENEENSNNLTLSFAEAVKNTMKETLNDQETRAEVKISEVKDEGKDLEFMTSLCEKMKQTSKPKQANLDTAPKIDVTPLHLSVYKEKIEHAEKLIEYGADVNLKDCFGMVPLHLAAMRGNLHMVQKLVKAGAVITMKDNKLQTPMDVALKNEHEKVANYFKGNDYMEQSQEFKETMLLKLLAISPQELQKRRQNEADINPLVTRTLKDIQKNITQFLIDLGSSPITQETEGPPPSQ